MRTRGFVRRADITPSPGAPAQFVANIRLVDAANVERYCRWSGSHFVGSDPAVTVWIQNGDEIEVVLEEDSRGRYTKRSFVHNHTRGMRYTFVRARTGCIVMLAIPTIVVAAPILAAALAAL